MVTHHLVKGGDIRSLVGAENAPRGSSVLKDRPRVLLALFRRSVYSIVGIAKKRDGNLVANYPAELMLQGERVLKFDPETMRHTPVADTGTDTDTDAATVAADDAKDTDGFTDTVFALSRS